LRKCCPKPYNTGHLDVVYLKIAGRMVDLRALSMRRVKS
jgi:hypothetical protein